MDIHDHVAGERHQMGGPARSSRRAYQIDKRDGAWLLALWLVVTACNLFKPYHIDDTAHLEIARWILSNPLHPMSGMLNWTGTEEAIWHTNQPHLYFYLLAGWGSLFGFSEPAMHTLQSFAALACILLFHRLARTLVGDNAVWATAIFVLGPAFVAEQNLMVDVPLLATWLAVFNLLICDSEAEDQGKRYGLAALALSAGLLIKYSSLALLPILAIALVLERRPAQAWCLLIPVATLAAWSAFNFLDYGGIHIIGRSFGDSGIRLGMALAWFIGIGALTPLGLMAAVQGRPAWLRSDRRIYAAMGAAFAALTAAVAAGLVSDDLSDCLLWLVFAANAALMCFAIAPVALATAKNISWRLEIPADRASDAYLLLWIIGTISFYFLFSPFCAARHVLLVLPPIILLITRQWGTRLSRASKAFGLALTIAISAGLCLSDWRFAAFYRDETRALARDLPRSATVWFNGHWGFQWYAKQSGFRQIDAASSRPRHGDIVIVSDEVDHQPLKQPITLRAVAAKTQAYPLLNILCTGRSARFYIFGRQEAPWSISRNCVNHLRAFRVIADADNR